MIEEKTTEEKIQDQDLFSDQNKEVILGICFGIGIGVFAGAVINNVMLGISAGGVVGAVTAVAMDYYKRFKTKNIFHKI